MEESGCSVVTKLKLVLLYLPVMFARPIFANFRDYVTYKLSPKRLSLHPFCKLKFIE